MAEIKTTKNNTYDIERILVRPRVTEKATISAENNVYVILLTNAVHPNRSYKYPNYFDWRQLLHSVAYEELELTKRNPEVKLKERWVKKFGVQR